MKHKKEFLSTDVLIIGGGIAGCMAAIGARESGNVDVLVLEKAAIARSGDAGGGNDHFLAHLNTGPEWDTDEAMAEYYTRLSQGLIDVNMARRLYLGRIREIIDKVESYGVEMRDIKTGQYIRTQSFGQPGPYFINFKGKDIKPALANQVRKTGARVLNHVAVTNLLTDGKRVTGAMGFSVREGTFYVVTARAIIIATGDAVRLWPNSSGLPFNTWMSPFNNGAGHAMAFRAGAELANMELTICSLVPKGFSAAGLNAFIGMGGYLWNAKEERYMQKYHPMAEGAPRNMLALGTFREIVEGRGPIYVDCRHLSKEALDHLTTDLLPVDKDTFMTFCEQKGIRLNRDMLEIQISEMQVAGITGSVNGIVIDETGRTSLHGLYSAGACTVPSFALSGALCTGYSIGIEAGQAATMTSDALVPDELQIKREFESVYEPLHQRRGLNYKKFEDKLRQIMADYVGYIKTEKGLHTGIEKLTHLEGEIDKIRAANTHELMRTCEYKDLLLIGKLVATAAIARKETRMGLSHVRGDYPDQDDKNFHGSIILKREDGGIHVAFRPAPSQIVDRG